MGLEDYAKILYTLELITFSIAVAVTICAAVYHDFRYNILKYWNVAEAKRMQIVEWECFWFEKFTC